MIHCGRPVIELGDAVLDHLDFVHRQLDLLCAVDTQASAPRLTTSAPTKVFLVWEPLAKTGSRETAKGRLDCLGAFSGVVEFHAVVEGLSVFVGDDCREVDLAWCVVESARLVMSGQAPAAWRGLKTTLAERFA